VSKKMSLFLGLFGALLLGLGIGLYAQSNSGAKLAKLYEEKADLSKMDLILLNTRVEVLQEMLKDDLSLPLAPTSVSYDAESQKIRTAVFIDATYLSKVNAAQLSKALTTRATALCVAPALAEGNRRYIFIFPPPKDYCVVSFFTPAWGRAGDIQTKEVASFEDGKLTMK
jgi:hypothetical protein